jgi:hypothetical protein
MLAKKLRIKEGTAVVALHTPEGYKNTIGELPEGASIKNKLAAQNDFVHLFIRNKAQLEKEIFKVCEVMNPGGLVWISYPKGSSGMQTDLTRDIGWECLQKLDMQRLSLISFDDKWSAFLMKNAPAKKENKASEAYHDISAQYSDPATKTVVVPDDLKTLLTKNKKASEIFNNLSYSCRKEYVLWIVSAKHEQTRKNRIEKTIQKLLDGKKNPAEK